jgi:RNA polymerase sigma-70 factor (ECF subfamily)
VSFWPSCCYHLFLGQRSEAYPLLHPKNYTDVLTDTLTFARLESASVMSSQDILIERLKQQDASALSELYDAYGGALYGVVLRIVRTPEVAEQVLQDVFLKVWRSIESYDATKGRLFTWLANIARNAAIDAVRSAQYRQQQKTDSLEILVHSPGNSGINPDHIGLRELVGQLEEKHRTLIELLYFQGYTQEEAAEAVGIPLGTVKTRVRQALRELRRAFGEQISAVGLVVLFYPECLMEMSVF